MNDRVLQVRLAGLLTLLLSALAAWLLPLMGSGAVAADGLLHVYFFDVGQGDAIFIVTPEGEQVLIDGGPSSDVVALVSAHMPYRDRTIETVLGTHPDLDHVTGLVDVLERYAVETIITTEATGASAAADAWVEAAAAEPDAAVFYARARQVYQLGASTTLTILSPATNPAALASNGGSIVARLSYDNTHFMLTGDAPQGIETYLVETASTSLPAQVLKLGHHGSDSSSAATFLRAVNPQYAVVSAGVNNRYEHPAATVLARVGANTEAAIVSTQHGTIEFVSDGSSVWLAE